MHIELHATPADAMLDETVCIDHDGAPLPDPTMLRATMATDDGAEWRSETPFSSSDRSMNWAWSMAQVIPPTIEYAPLTLPSPARVRLELIGPKGVLASTSLQRRFIPDNAIVERDCRTCPQRRFLEHSSRWAAARRSMPLRIGRPGAASSIFCRGHWRHVGDFARLLCDAAGRLRNLSDVQP
jgi:hypothetical protein